jgi:hypothetical protein
MGRYVIRLDDGPDDRWYLVWSTVVDAPLTYGLSRGAMLEYLLQCTGDHAWQAVERMDRVDAKGTSSFNPGASVDNLIECNRAGPNETKLTREQIIEQYCRTPPE